MRPADGSPSVHAYERLILISILIVLGIIAYPKFIAYKTFKDIESSIKAVRIVQNKIDDFTLDNKQFPQSLDIIFQQKIPKFEHIRNISWNSSGTLIIVFDEKLQSRIDTDREQTIIFNAQINDDKIKWDCAGGTLIKKYKNKICPENQN